MTYRSVRPRAPVFKYTLFTNQNFIAMKLTRKSAILAAVLVMSALFVLANVLPETEPNNTPATAQSFVLGDTLLWKINSANDADYGKTVLPPGAYIATINYPNGTSGFRDWFDLLDTAGAEINPHYCYYPGGDVHLLYFKICTTTTVFFRARMNQDVGQPTDRNYSFTIAADPLDRECDDAPATATVVNASSTFISRLALTGDHDWVKIPNVDAGPLTVGVNNPTQPGLQIIADLFQDPAGAPLETSVGGSLNTSVTQAGVYFLRFRYANPDTASRFQYNANIVYFETALNACDSAVVGVIDATKIGRLVTVQAVLQNVDSISVVWGDGTVSDSLTHTYLYDGSYTITITGLNDCSNAVASTQVKLVAGVFAVGNAEGAAGSTIKVPFYSVNYEGTFSSVDGQVVYNSSVATLVGIESGKMTVNQQAINLSLGYFSQTTGTSAISIAPGDTIFYLLFKLTGNPGDSSAVDLNGNGAFAAFYFDLGNNNPLIDAQLISGSVKIYKEVDLKVITQTPNGAVVTNATVTVYNGDTTITAVTNAQGIADMVIPYDDTLIISVNKDTIIRTSINSQDAFIGQRIIVLLPVNGLTPYMIVATDVNCDGKINSNDISLLLRWIVGLIPDFPCADGQLVFIPETVSFPTYPDPDFFNFSKKGVILHPDATNGETMTFVAPIRGDVNSSASAGVIAVPLPQDRSTDTWKYTALPTSEGLLKVSLWADAQQAISGGGMAFKYDASQYEFLEMHTLQAQDEMMNVVNDRQAGELNIAFINQYGRDLIFDHELPLLEMVLRPKQQNALFELSLAPENDAMVFDSESRTAEVVLARNQSALLALVPKVYPNPSQDHFYISLPAGTGSRIEVYDLLGRSVYSTSEFSGYQIEVPTATWPSGIYSCRVTVNAKVYTQLVQVNAKND